MVGDRAEVSLAAWWRGSMTFSASPRQGGRGFARVSRLAGWFGARVRDWFDICCSELGFCRVWIILFAHVRQERFPLSHVCETGLKNFAPNWSFTESQPLSLHSCDAGASFCRTCAETAADGSPRPGVSCRRRTEGPRSRCQGAARRPGFPEKCPRDTCAGPGNTERITGRASAARRGP